MEKEIWKDVPGYEGYYQVSNLGNVKSIRLGSNLSLYIKRNYLNTSFNVNGIKKPYPVHQIVAMAFLGHKPCGYEIVVDHINNIKTDNRVENLQLISHRNNVSKDRKNKTSEFTGVSWHNNTKKWVANIFFNNEKVNLGYFKNGKDASNAYINALKSIEEGTEIKVKRKIKSSKYKGVSFSLKNKKWRASILLNKKFIHLGYFENEKDAYLEFKKAKQSLSDGVEIVRNVRKTKYKYVSWNNGLKKWHVRVSKNGKRHHIGFFDNQHDAYLASLPFL
jgi:hypothetical protein